METPSLRWNDAQVSNRTLTVPIEGELPDGWTDKFHQTASLLGRSRYDDVECEGGGVRVGGVAEGDEDSLRHFLESVVQEANAAFDLGGAADEGDEEHERPEQDRDADDPDARMTDRFRDFGEPAPDD